VLRQSEHRPRYTAALDRLAALGLVYPCRCTRAEIRAALSAPQEGLTGPAPYPGTCRGRPIADTRPGDALRLDLRGALDRAGSLAYEEFGPTHAGRHEVDPAALLAGCGDVVLARRDIGAAYHLAVVVDDAHQRVSHVVRGADLWPSTPLHRLLQAVLGLPVPVWYHHRLIRDAQGRRLAKRDDARALSTLRAEGMAPEEVAALLGLDLR
jgi:glutamyl-Q tRNA(Asp) synthetase